MPPPSASRALMAAAGKEVAGLRIGVKKGGCAGMEYTMEYADSARPIDELVEDKGVRILIDPTAVLFLLGTEMDYRTDRLSSGFVFNNPNQTSACGCGEFGQSHPRGRGGARRLRFDRAGALSRRPQKYKGRGEPGQIITEFLGLPRQPWGTRTGLVIKAGT